MSHVYFVLNHAYNVTINNAPINAATGSTCDISPLLRFHFWQPVCFNADDAGFPSKSTELKGRFVGISENTGHAITFRIFNPATSKIIDRSHVRPADEPDLPNLKADCLTAPKVAKSLYDEHVQAARDTAEDSTSSSAGADSASPAIKRPLPILDSSDLVGRTFLAHKEDGQRLRARIVRALNDYKGDLARDSSHLKFTCSMQDDAVEELFTCNETLDHLNNFEEDDLVEWRFKSITGHEGPLP